MTRTVQIELTEQQARGLIALASRGRVLLDIDPLFLPRRDDRFAARQAVAHLRTALTPTALTPTVRLTAPPTSTTTESTPA